MILAIAEFLVHAQLDRQTLDVWIEEGWLVPDASEAEHAFYETDLARVRLIRDLIEDLGVNAEGVGIVLNLVDQVHGLRSALAETLSREPQNSST